MSKIQTNAQNFRTKFREELPHDLLYNFLQHIVQHFKIYIEGFHAAFPARCPTRFSHKNFPQEFPARFSTRSSCKNFPSWILIGCLPITLFQMLNFHQSLPFLNWLFPLLPVLQDFRTNISCKIFLQEFPDWILIGWLPITLFQMLNFGQSLPFLNWLSPLLPVPQDFWQNFPARISWLDPDWLAPNHPIPNLMGTPNQ